MEDPAKTPEPACPMCHSTHRIQDAMRAEVHCADCGLVFESQELVATAPPPGPLESSEGSGRGIGPFALASRAHSSLGSTLTLSRDGQGRRLDYRRRYEFQHLKRVMQRQTTRASVGGSRPTPARGEIALAADHLRLPPVVVAEAERIVQDARSRGLSRGRTRESWGGAAG